MPPVTITFLLEELNYGGTQRQTLELAARLDRRLFAPQIWTLWPGMDMLARAQAADVPVTALTSDARLRPGRAAAALWSALRQERPPLLHLCTAFPNIWGRILGRLAHLPAVVASCRGQANVRGQYEWALHGLAHAHICNAQSIADALRACGVPEAQLHYIPNGVDTDYFSPDLQPLAVENNGLLCVGRLVADKDHETLLEALALLRKRLPARLHLVGDGPLRARLEERVCALALADAVVFHGADADVRRHFRAARVLVLASRSEGMPNVVLEGMACGLPVVATQVGGIPDLVKPGLNGFLVPPGRPELLAAALEEALSAGPEPGKAGREIVVRQYSLEQMTRRHEEVYAGLV